LSLNISMLMWSAFVATAAALAWALTRLWRMAAIGAAYRSKVLCSIVFGTARSVDLQRLEDVSAESYWLLRLFRSHADAAARTVTTSLFGLRARTAIYRPGLGATLFLPRSSASLPPSRVALQRTAVALAEDGQARVATASLNVRPTADLKVRATPGSLQRVVNAAFAEPYRKRQRRTRAIVVLRDGDIVAEQYAPGFDADTPLPGWSMTKSVLNALLGILVGEKRLSLEGKALLPEWQPPDPRAAITVEDLLRMRSGLQFSEVYADFSSDVIEMLFNRPDAAGYASSLPLIFAPGTTWSYASGTSNILSLIVRRVVGEGAYLEWPRHVLFEPLGMTSAILEPDASGTFVCSSFMLATARDWARFGQLFLQDGVWNGTRVLPDGWVSLSTTPTRQSPRGNYGAHWWLKLQPELGGGTRAAARIPADAFFAVGHESQTLTVIPSRRLVVVRLGLSVHDDAWNQAEFLTELLDAI
jgi:CubicO group peptidase (beta-lactamase class C family)